MSEIETSPEGAEEPTVEEPSIVESSVEEQAVDHPVEAPSDEDVDVDEAPAPVKSERLRIEVDHSKDITYALAYNRSSIIRSLKITNEAGGLTGPLSVSATIKWSVSDESPARPFTSVVELPAFGESIVVDKLDFRLDDSVMVDVTESTNARLVVTVTDAMGLVQEWAEDVAVHARTQWLSQPDLVEMTAAFVQPNHPTVNEVLAKAGSILEAQGRSRALSGYQGDEEHIRAMGAAIFLALQSMVDQYINPPPIFVELGQKVRPIDEVLAQRQGTCIDLACAYAACLEQAGLRPVIFRVHGHAFSGFFLREKMDLGQRYIDDFSTMLMLIESGEIVAAETTVLCGDGSFDFAAQAIREHFSERSVDCETCAKLIAAGADTRVIPHLMSMVDVERCHSEGILPLPVRIVRDGVVTVIIDPGPQKPVIVERRDEKTRKLLESTAPARVQQWKNALLDLTFRNSLLNYKPSRTGVEMVVPKGVLGTIEDLLSDGGILPLVAHDNLNKALKDGGYQYARDLEQQDLEQLWNANKQLFASIDGNKFVDRLRTVVSKAKVEEQDTGSNNLFMTFGTLKWTDPKSTTGEVRSPIFMIPIRIKIARGATSAQVFADPNGFTTINYCLIEALRAKMKMTLQWFSDDMRDAAGLNIDAGLQALRSEILEKGLTNSGFEVIEDASIGVLRFSKIRLWKDLDEHWEKFATNSVVSHLIEGGRGHYVDPADPEGAGIPAPRDYELLNPQSADGPQALAVRRALAGHSFVLEGPPGTGKSQTITNLLAAALASGKKVLFVAEKQAALQVVHERLAKVGLDPFCLELHDKGAKPEKIKEQLKAALDFRPDTNMVDWNRMESDFEQATRYLDTYCDRVHGSNDAGMSYFEAYVRLLRLDQKVVGEPGAERKVASCTRRIVKVDAASIEQYRRVLSRLEESALVAKPRPLHPWAIAGAVSFDGISRSDLAAAISSLSSLSGNLDDPDPWRGLIASALSVEDLDGIASVVRAQIEHLTPNLDQWRDIARPDWSGRVSGLLDQIDARIAGLGPVIAGTGVEGLKFDYSSIRSEVSGALESFMIGRKGRVTTALSSLAQTAPFSTASHEQLLALIDNLNDGATDVRRLVGELIGVGAGVVPGDWFPDAGAAQAALRERIVLASTAGKFLASGGEIAESTVRLSTGLAAATPAALEIVDSLRGWLRRLTELVGSTPESIRMWQGDRTLREALDASLPEWNDDVESGTFRHLNRWLAFTSEVAALDDDSLSGFRDELRTGRIAAHEASDAFERAFLTATLQDVGEARDLDVFEYSDHDRRIMTFRHDLVLRQNALRRVIPNMLFESRGFDASASVGTVGALRQELGSRRRGARSIRELLKKYADLITGLTPCFLMSPDSVANFIEPGAIEFDLVVFDEASQITVSSAVGALGRAKAAVIVGDSKQMPPTSFGVKSGSGEEDEFDAPLAELADAVVTDAESILDECVESRMDRAWLEWHYRSEDEVLIQFSNEHYYEKRLASFPGPRASIPGCGIEYLRVQGQFDHGGKRTNEIEADAIVAEVLRRLADPIESRDSIGIVTLNAEQRDLITKKLQETGNPDIQKALDPSSSEEEEEREGLFVLNLESVQGRERDVIILGTSFSKKADGGKMPLNFGPLMTKGGERRLNVAVTRARRKVVVVTSFEPSDLATANSIGMVHLREYLEMAKAVSGGSRPETVRPVDDGNDLHQEAIASALRARGLEVGSNVGLSSFRVDLALTLPELKDRWLVGVLLDGPSWAGRLLASDRDALPIDVLQNKMGWRKIQRVWLPSWRKDSKEIVDELERLVRQLAVEPEPEPESLPAAEAVAPVDVAPESVEAIEPVETATAPSNDSDAVTKAEEISGPAPDRVDPASRPFEPIPKAEVIGDLSDLTASNARGIALLSDLVDRFGPVRRDILLKATLNSFGLSKVSEGRLKEFAGLVPKERTVSTKFGDFVYPAALVENGVVRRSDFDWYRTSTFTERKIEEIAPHEVANCAVAIARSAFSISVEELVSSILIEFGYSRKTAATIALVTQMIEWCVAEGFLVDDDGMLKAVGNGS